MAVNIIPKQKKGNKSDNSSTIKWTTNQEANVHFRRASHRLLDVNNWEKICDGIMKAKFILCDITGKKVNRLAKEHDYFKIDIPGPGSVEGDGYDWVQIESIATNADKKNDSDLISVSVRPASSPQNDKKSIAHFFSDEATTTFLVKRSGKMLTAEIHGRNEKPNVLTENIIGSVRNKIIAKAAMISFSDVQWKQLVIGLLS